MPGDLEVAEVCDFAPTAVGERGVWRGVGQMRRHRNARQEVALVDLPEEAVEHRTPS